MKIEMEYKNMMAPAKILYKGMFKGVMVVIVSYGTHPCAYLFFKKGHPMYGKDSEQADDIVSVHGGFTYSSARGKSGISGLDTKDYKWCLGWDYAHADDQIGNHIEGQKWTVDEILSECRIAVNTIIQDPGKDKGLEENPLLDLLCTLTKDYKGDPGELAARMVYKVISKDPVRDFPCKMRMTRKLKGLCREELNKAITGKPVYITRCKYCGEQFVTNSTRIGVCSDLCEKKNNQESVKKYMHKYMKNNREKFGYSNRSYASQRKEILEKIKSDRLSKNGRSSKFKCKVCGKEFDYVKDHYSIKAEVCRNPECKSKYYHRKR